LYLVELVDAIIQILCYSEDLSLLIKWQSDHTLVRMSCYFTYKSLIFLEINLNSTSYPPEPIPPLSLLVGGDREETRWPPGLRHAPRHQSVGSWSGTGSAASSSEPRGRARGQASAVVSGGGGAGTGRDEERGHGRTLERTGLGGELEVKPLPR
jgi:hypothetical protein